MQRVHVAHARQDGSLGIARVLLQLRGPWRGAHRLKSEVGGSSSDHGRQVLEHLVVLQGELDEVVGEQLGLGPRGLNDSGDLGKALKEDESVRRRQLEVKLREHVPLHLEDLLACVCLVRNVDEVAALGGVDLLILRGDEHGSHSNELQVAALDLLLLQIAVDQVGREVERLRHELEFQVHLDEPVNQYGAHLLVDVVLLAHIRG
mmetsp:Transcript_12893/g.33015  ORF Transcript_12893/g.33015 Transcript_12893/m.33015 type:complete len:205 (+) Transcript_12893:448-1062(+)